MGGVLILVTATGETDTNSEWDILDSLGPDELVELGVDTDILSLHLDLGELLDLVNGTWGALLGSAKNFNVMFRLKKKNSTFRSL